MLKVICPYCQCCFDTNDISDEGIICCNQCGKQFAIDPSNIPSENNDASETAPQDSQQAETTEETNHIKLFLNANINIILVAVNTVVTLFALSGALYMWICRQEIHDDILKEKYIIILEKYSGECEKKLNDFGNFLLHYAGKNDGKLPAERNFSDEYMKYADLSYVSKGCSVCYVYDLHFDKVILTEDKRNADTVLISCPDHKRGFFADGKCRDYSKEDEK